MFTLEQFNTIIANIARAQARATTEIGKALLAALYFANVNKDAGAANALVKCLRKSTKQQAILDLLEKHGKLAWIKADKKFEFFDAKTPDWNAETVKTLREVCNNWESFKLEKAAVEEFDLMEAIRKQLDRAESYSKKGVKVSHAELAEKIAALLGATA
jgi:hypothetical protein